MTRAAISVVPIISRAPVSSEPRGERAVGAITARGYSSALPSSPCRKRASRPRIRSILSYLVAYDHLCQLGYDIAQVEEAQEMFQNCETKAEKFLHLLGQFTEMGFQQNTIKEVLLVHENHQERALEELMMRVA
ncbi:ubiquitin-associated protein 1-like protein [Lates japonicus]|uniref:Ubiquitin-associated protein 1-like protein n=1 Tax=Lates japonicus TaxID=270547 RepID=A0AAD3MR62_LATJO|nr:ubiquitin-associated protein 1-like protein [Lates japonicus]